MEFLWCFQTVVSPMSSRCHLSLPVDLGRIVVGIPLVSSTVLTPSPYRLRQPLALVLDPGYNPMR